MNAFAQLYEGRLEYARATPGSREWWQAIRRLRMARRRINDAISAIVDAITSLAEIVAEPLLSIAEAMPDLSPSAWTLPDTDGGHDE
ncbi:hypothetical protein SAMN05216388_101755 [Halorientalis persicus]|uniref:Uncharacterized protein n=1 Tax=Halorientalis persicus TaxID=1367881 RepID=A0A1H8RW18_9EURY|nr:hypothetical protein [Halorientalis persicus]SEO70552.1 hypothetical protein SAMN05216388_101755 [Halorientalis persicus]